MSLVSATIGATTISSRIQKMVIKRKATEGIGTFELTLNNQDNALDDGFPVDSLLTVNLGSTFGGTLYPFFKGYVDVCDLISDQDDKSKIIETAEVSGRDLGQDLQNKTVWGSDSAAIETIVYNLLHYGNSPYKPGLGSGYTEIDYTLPSPLSGVQCLYGSGGRTFIADNLKRMMAQANWDCYVDLNKNLQMFPVGTISSGIVLTTGLNGNIKGNVHFKPVDGTELRNVIIGFGGKCNDSWTDVTMAQFWECYDNTAIVDLLSGGTVAVTGSGADVTLTGLTVGLTYTGVNGVSGGTAIVVNQLPASPNPYQFVQAGSSSLLIVNTQANSNKSLLWGLTFPKFFQWTLPFNWINVGEVQWSMFMYGPTGTPEGEPQPVLGSWQMTPHPEIWLRDSVGNVITWIFGGSYRYNSWLTFSVPVGYNLSNEAQIYTSAIWDTPDLAVIGQGALMHNFFGVSAICSNYDKWIYTEWTDEGTDFPASPTYDRWFIYKGSGQAKGAYRYTGSSWVLENASATKGNQGFNWQVTRMRFGFWEPISSFIGQLPWLLFDNLRLPDIVRVSSVADHSGLNDYGGGVGVCAVCAKHFNATTLKQRQLPLTRSNLTYQSDVSSWVEAVANQRCNPVAHGDGTYDALTPLSTLHLCADGRAGLVGGVWKWLPGLTVSLNGVSNYRFIELTHTIKRGIEGTGYTHTVDINAVLKFWQLDMEQWTYAAHGLEGIVRQIHDRVNALENTYQILRT